MSTNTETLHLDSNNFDSTVGNGVTLVDFWAPWCGPCKALGPTIDQLAGDYQGKATIAKVNIDDSPEVAQRYGVQSIPTLIFFKDGEESGRAVGIRPKNQLAETLDKLLEG